MEEELQKLYGEYQTQNYSIEQAFRALGRSGYNTGEARRYMRGLYEGATQDQGDPKKKSQDSSQSESSSEQVSTAPTSTTDQPQQPEAGDSGYNLSDNWDDLVDDFLPTSLNVQAANFEGVQTLYGEDAVGGHKLNPYNLLNNNPDEVMDRMIFNMQTSSFDKFARSAASPVQASSNAFSERYKGLLPESLLSVIEGEDGTPHRRYNDVLDRLAIAYVLDEKTSEMVNNGVPLEDALKENEDWVKRALEGPTGTQTMRRRGVPRDVANRLAYKKGIKQTQKAIEKKRAELEMQYMSQNMALSLKRALPAEYQEVTEEGAPTDEAKLKLAQLENQFRKRYGMSIDLSGDGVVGNKPTLRVFAKGRGIGFEGEFVDKAAGAFENLYNAAAYLGGNLYAPILKGSTGLEPGGLYAVPDDSVEGGIRFMNQQEAYMFEAENGIRRREIDAEKLQAEMNEYQKGIASSILSGDFENAFKQSLDMTAEGLPYMTAMALNPYLGVTGTAAFMALQGGAVEFTRIRNDISFDTFVDADGKEYSYYEAAEKADSFDPNVLKKQFTIKTNNAGRFGYGAAVVAGDFGSNVAMNRALMGSYQTAARNELKNWFRGYLQGQRIAVTEGSIATTFNIFLQQLAEAEVQGGVMDFEAAITRAIDQSLGIIPLTSLMHTVGSAARHIKGTARSNELIPMNADELSRLDDLVKDYTQKIAKNGQLDPRFAAEANLAIRNARDKALTLRRQNENYLDYLRKNNPEQLLEVSNLVVTLDRLKLNFDATNDPNLRLQYKEQAAGVLSRLDEVYQENRQGYEGSADARRGVREREDRREEDQVTMDDVQKAVSERTTPQTRTDTDVPLPGDLDPTLSPDARRNERSATVKRFGQRAKNIWNKWFKSNGGIKNPEIEEVVRSRERLASAWINEVSFDARSWRNLLRQARRGPGGIKLKGAILKDTQAAMLDALEGKIKMDDPRLNNLSADSKEQLVFFREQIDGLSESLIATLEKQPLGTPEQAKARAELIEKIRANKGRYLTTSYELFNDGGRRLDLLTQAGGYDAMPPEIQKVYKNAIDYIAERYDQPFGDVPLTKAERQNLARRELNAYLMGLKNQRDGGGGFSMMGAMDAPFLKAKKDLPKPIEDLLGKITDPMNAYVTTASKLNSYLSNARWQTEMSLILRDSGMARMGAEFEGMDSPNGKMVKLSPTSEAWLPLADLYVPQNFKTAFDNLMPLKSLEDGLYKTLVQASAAVKVGKTVLAPTTTARNLISGLGLSAANGHIPFARNPMATLDAMSMAWGVHGKYKRNQTYRAEVRKLIELGVLNDGANARELMQTLNDSMGGDVNRILQGEKSITGLRIRGSIMDVSQKLYAFGDDFYKVNGYYQERKAFLDSGMSMAEAEAKAAQRVRDGYPTYSKISRGTKEIRRNPFIGSFVSFPYEMWRTTTNQFKFIAEDFQAGRTTMAIRRAAGLTASLVSAYALAEESKDRLGFTDQDDEAVRSLGPEWQKFSNLFYLGVENGSPYFMDMSYMLPHEAILKPLKAVMGMNPDDENFQDNLRSALWEAGSPFFSNDVTFGFIREISENTQEGGIPIVDTEPGESTLSAAIRQPDKVFVHFLKKAAPGFVGNVTEFLRAGAVEEVFKLVSGDEELPNGHPLENAMDQFYEYFPPKTRYKEYTLEDAVYGLLGFRVTYLPVDVAGANKTREWNEYANQVKYREFSPFTKQPELGDPKKIADAAQEYVEIHNRNHSKGQNVTNMTVRLDLNVGEIYAMHQAAGLSDDASTSYIANVYLPPSQLTEKQVDAMVERETWYKSLSTEEKVEKAITIYKNATAFNKELVRLIIAECRRRNLTEEQTQAILNVSERGGDPIPESNE
tara:strand:- start:1862 stop:7435 length:5574 start_codon:yes stop_codon:yes gene_type:complete